MRSDKDNLIVNLTFDFAIEIIKCSKILQQSHDYALSNQLLRAGISIGANVREAQNAESKADFIHKFKIAVKEVDETEYWLALCKELYGHEELTSLNKQLTEIQKIINKIISTSKKA